MNKYFTCIPTNEELDFWIQNELNVLFVGKHGVGKTSTILDAFKRNNIKFKYFSASTMDPFIDFIGVPKEVKDSNGSYIDLIKPKDFREDNDIEAIIFDEYNRAPKKVRNAVMELIQFKSINGKKFPKLKMIWVAINPDGDETNNYDVEPLDEAQKDRFHIRIEYPYEINREYFNAKYGEKITSSICEWWNNLSDDVKNDVSPRRVDTAMNVFYKNGNIRHCLPPSSNISSLLARLKEGPIISKFEEYKKSENIDEIKKLLENNNSYEILERHVINTKYMILIPNEKLSNLIITNKSVINHCIDPDNISVYKDILSSIAKTTSKKTLANKINKAIKKSTTISKSKNKVKI